MGAPGRAAVGTNAGVCARACAVVCAGAAAFGGGAVGAAACGVTAAPAPPIMATTAPTGATAPAGTFISVSTPLVIDGTSIDTLSVSISNRLSPFFPASPGDLNHFVMLPSATVSPSCGIRTSIPEPQNLISLLPHLTKRRSPTQRNVLRLEELHQPFVRAFAADAALLHAAEGRRRIGHEPAVEPDHAEVELFRNAQTAADVFRIKVRHETVFSVIGALD